jgi:hypothetical protein
MRVGVAFDAGIYHFEAGHSGGGSTFERFELSACDSTDAATATDARGDADADTDADEDEDECECELSPEAEPGCFC